MTGPSFRGAELEGWDRKAGYWDDSLGLVTLGAIDPLLEAVEVGPGVRVLDIACGTGALAATAARRGADVIGMDFAPTMIAEAIRRHPGIDFRVGDAEAIPFCRCKRRCRHLLLRHAPHGAARAGAGRSRACTSAGDRALCVDVLDL